MKKECYQCHDQCKTDLRSYGPRGEWVCYECGMKPENITTTEQSFINQLDACGPTVVIGLEEGPVPFGRQQLNG